MVPAAVRVPADFKTVEMLDPDARNQNIIVQTTHIVALANEPLERFLENDKTLIIINGDLLEQIASETNCPTWLFDETAGADTLICGS